MSNGTPMVTGNNIKDLVSLTGKVTGENSHDGVEVSPRELKMLQTRFDRLEGPEKKAASTALRQHFPELHGAITNNHI